MLTKLIDEIVKTYKEDPRNKVHIDESTLLAAAAEETGNEVSITQLREAISKYIAAEMDDDDQAIYDGATYACGLVAKHCFSEDLDIEVEDREVDYEIDWLENSDGSYTAEVRPS